MADSIREEEDILIRLFLSQNRLWRALSIQFLNIRVIWRKRLRRIKFISHEIPVVGDFDLFHPDFTFALTAKTQDYFQNDRAIFIRKKTPTPDLYSFDFQGILYMYTVKNDLCWKRFTFLLIVRLNFLKLTTEMD